jgi:hypothetical protein
VCERAREPEDTPAAILRKLLAGSNDHLMCTGEDGAMTTSTAIIVNGIIAVGLLALLAYVMQLGHRLAGSTKERAHWSVPLELEHARAGAGADSDLERAA